MSKEKLQSIIQEENLGFFIKMAMNARNLGVKEISEKVLVTESYMHYIINNNRKPSVRLLRDLLEIFNITEEQLIEVIQYYNDYKGPHIYTYTMKEMLKRIVLNMEKQEQAV